ncbi:MAG: hypothetical protein KGZ63_00700 [Clostridiales bacterium]|jgi:hypothetical protein|nr:hypothetical protein [Clostridiales bacterium]
MFQLLRYMEEIIGFLDGIYSRGNFEEARRGFNMVKSLFNVSSEQIEFVYIKNLFLSDDSWDIFVICAGKVIVCTVNSQIIQVEELKVIENMKLTINERTQRCQLELKVNNDTTIELDNFTDTNPAWRHAYYSAIMCFYKILSGVRVVE